MEKVGFAAELVKAIGGIVVGLTSAVVCACKAAKMVKSTSSTEDESVESDTDSQEGEEA